MKIAGIGFRDGATLASVLDALRMVGADGVIRLGVPARKAGDPLCEALSAQGYDLTWVSDDALAVIDTPTQSAIARQHYGTGSVAEAAALSVARAHDPQAQLVARRMISTDRLATAAVALTGDMP